MYKGVGGREGGGDGGVGRAGGSSKPETKAAQPSGQELTEPAIVGLQHGKDRGGRRGPLVPQCHLINAQQYPHRLSMAGVGRQKAVCKSRPGHLWLYQYCVWVVLECGYNVKQ